MESSIHQSEFYDGEPWLASEHRRAMKIESVSFGLGNLTVELECESAYQVAEQMTNTGALK